MKIDRKTWIIIAAAFALTVLFTCLIGFSGNIEREKSVENESGVVVQTSVDSGAYFHLGDWVAIVAASLIGGPYAAIAAGLGALVADLIMGSYVYMLPSLLIKGGLCLLIGALLKKGLHWVNLFKAVGYAGILMVCGYFLFDLIIMGDYHVAALSLPLNLLQVAANGVVAVLALKLTAGVSHYKSDGSQSMTL